MPQHLTSAYLMGVFALQAGNVIGRAVSLYDNSKGLSFCEIHSFKVRLQETWTSLGCRLFSWIFRISVWFKRSNLDTCTPFEGARVLSKRFEPEVGDFNDVLGKISKAVLWFLLIGPCVAQEYSLDVNRPSHSSLCMTVQVQTVWTLCGLWWQLLGAYF